MGSKIYDAKNWVQWDENKTMQEQSKLFENDRKGFTVKFCIELCVSSANLKMGRFVFLYAPSFSISSTTFVPKKRGYLA